MEILSKSILIVSIVWILWQFLRTRRLARGGKIIVPPFFATLLVFSLCVLGVIVLGVSPFHLLWLLPVSFIVGIVLLAIPFTQMVIMTLLMMLAMPRNWEEEEEEPVMSRRERRRKTLPASKRKKR